MAAQRGTAAHRVLELMALAKLAKQQNKDTFDIDDHQLLVESSPEDLMTFMETHENLTKSFSKSDIKEYRRFVYNALTLQDSHYDPRKRSIIAPEKRMVLPIEEEWAKGEDGKYLVLSGIIDLVTQVDENTYEIIDWKTGSTKDFHSGKEQGYEDFVKDPQLRFYHYAATRMFGAEKDYIVSIVFVKSMESFSIAFMPEDVPETLDLIKNKYAAISSCDKPERIQSWKCKRFCEYGKRDHTELNMPMQEQFITGGIAKLGDPCTMCDIVHNEIEVHGIDWVTENRNKYNAEKNS